VSPQRLLAGLVAAFLTGASCGGAHASTDPPKVVATILPIHALTASVMAGAGEPVLLRSGNASPHGYQLKPSDARALQDADVVVWVGEGLESFMARPLEELAGRARLVTLVDAPGIELLPAREGGAWEAHDHDEANHGHGGAADGHDRGVVDPHVWLSPRNAKAIVRAIAEALAAADPARAPLYAGNAERTIGAIEALDGELRAKLAPVRNRPFVVFHDAYQYLEAAYGLAAAGSITVSPDRPPGARRLAELRERIERSGAVCVFSEVLAPSPLVAGMVADAGVGTGELDPEGSATLMPGPDAYAGLMRYNVGVLADCLTRQS
jgi:zinc transport system substrate-binding protein